MFTTREDAGRRLAQELLPYADQDPVVLGLPRGGVPVAVEVAAVLGTTVDVLVVRKLGSPWNPEFGFGAVGEGGVAVIDTELASRLGVDRQMVARVRRAEEGEVERRVRSYRRGRPGTPLAGRTVIVVDDGIATGVSARAAVELVRQRGAERVIMAAPVASPSSVAVMAEVADEVVVVFQPTQFHAVGQFYEDFTQVPDAQVVAALDAARRQTPRHGIDAEVVIPVDGVDLAGHFRVPAHARGVVLFVHGSGSSRRSPRNIAVADLLDSRGMGTLLFDLLSEDEAAHREHVFDIGLLAHRLLAVTDWVAAHEATVAIPGSLGANRPPLGYFGASTGAGAALVAAALAPARVAAVVSRGGRPDLAEDALPRVQAPTLLIVGGLDEYVLHLNRAAMAAMQCPVRLEVVPGATHLFEEPGTLEAAAGLAGDWFEAEFAAYPAAAHSAG